MSLSIESYGYGFIVAEYDEKIQPFGCRYTGPKEEWKTQPIGISTFNTREDAETFVKNYQANA